MGHLEPLAGLPAARPLWTGLAARSDNVFATWEWADTWWRHFGADGRLALYACLRGGEPFAIAPLHAVSLGPLRLLRFIGHGPGDVLGMICGPADAADAGTLLVEGLRDRGTRRTVLLAERVPGGPAAKAFGGQPLHSEANPSLAIGGRDWDDFLASASKNMREKIRRSTRRLEHEHELAFELCERPDQVGPMMETLFDLHTLRWGDAGRFGSPPIKSFHRDFATVAMERGWLRLWTMRIDGRPAAAWYGFRFGGVEAYYQSGRDPRLDRHSVGFLMLIRTLKAAFDDRMATYGFLRGDEPYKERFATDNRSLQTRAVGLGGVGRGAVRAGQLASRVPALRPLAASLVG